MRLLLLALLFTLLAGCESSAPPTPVDEGRNPPTLVSPGWTEATTPISLDNVNTLAFLGRLDPPSALSTLFTADISPDGTRMVGLNSEEILSWNLVSGALDFATARLDTIQVYYSPDKTEVYAVFPDGDTNILNADSGVLKNNFSGHASFNGVAAYYPATGWLALGGGDGAVRVWDTLERQALVTFEAHSASIAALAFSPDGARLATGSAENQVRVWDWAARAQVAEAQLASPPIKLAFAPDGGQVAVGLGEGAALWTLDGSTVQPIQTGEGGASAFLLYAPNGEYLVGGSLQSGLYLWSPADGALISRFPGVLGDRVGMAFSPDGTMLATSVMGGGVSIWNLGTITEQGVARADLNVGTDRIFDLRWTPDGLLLLLFDASGAVYVWGVSQGATAATG
jgi:WD40 repeat protein